MSVIYWNIKTDFGGVEYSFPAPQLIADTTRFDLDSLLAEDEDTKKRLVHSANRDPKDTPDESLRSFATEYPNDLMWATVSMEASRFLDSLFSGHSGPFSHSHEVQPVRIAACPPPGFDLAYTKHGIDFWILRSSRKPNQKAAL